MCLVHDGGEARGYEGGSIPIGESDDSHIFRNAQTFRLDGIEGCIGDDIIEGEDGIRRILTFQESERGIARHVEVYLVAYHQIAVDRDAVLTECFEITVLAAAHHIEMVRTTDESHTARTGFYHVLGGLLSRHITISHHLGEHVLQTAAGKEYQGHPHLVELLEVRIVGGVLRQTGDDTLYMHIEKVIQSLRLALMVFMTVGTDDGIAQLGGIVFDAIEDSGIIMGNEIWHDDTNHSRSFLAETLGERIRAIVQLLGELLHLLGHLLSYFMTVSQCSGNGSYTDTKLISKVL